MNESEIIVYFYCVLILTDINLQILNFIQVNKRNHIERCQKYSQPILS